MQVKIASLFDKGFYPWSPLAASRVGPGHRIGNPKHRLLMASKVVVDQFGRGLASLDGGHNLQVLSRVLAGLPSFDDQSSPVKVDQIAQDCLDCPGSGHWLFVG